MKSINVLNNQVVRIVQVTDSHLFADKSNALLGINTWQSFNAVIDLVKAQQTEFDLLLCTGDIAQDYSPEAYQYFQQTMAQFPAPLVALAGNHDEMTQLSATHMNQHKVLDCGAWVILSVHTPVLYKSHGFLEASELEWLESQLQLFTDRHVLVTCHHHAQKLASTWLDGVGLLNGDKLTQLLSQFDNVRGVLFGHVHQEVDYVWQGMRFLSTPSTCIQFKPKSSDFALDTTQPGYSWLDLHADGRIVSKVERVVEPVFYPDMTASGY